MQNKPKSINSFIKGMNKDLDNLSRTKDSYYDAKNFVNVDKEGLLFNLTNERGTINKETFTSTERPGDVYNIIGHYILNDETIVFGVSSDNLHSEIGVFDKDDIYTTILNNDELNFSIEHQVDAEARVFYNGNRVVYFTDNYNPIRVINLDNPPTSNIDENTSSYPNRTLPYIDYVETLNSGTLKTGCYLFTIRYLDSNLNTTPFGPVSNPIPVVDDTRNVSTNRNEYDGSPIDTDVNKSLRLQINNVDTNFQYIEIVVIYFEGETRQRVIRSAGLLEVTGATMDFTYDLSLSNDRNIQVDIEEISQEPVFYNKAKCVTQKDGILVYSNLSSDTELDEFQEIANRITVEYQIEEVLFNENITGGGETYSKSDTAQSAFLDYKNEELTFNMKGYMREEVYSLGVQFVYKNGAKSLVYHIPGTDKTTLGNNTTATIVNSSEIDNNTGNRTGELGTYISTLTYPTGQNYPGVSGDYDTSAGYQDNYIRHHKMPSLSQEPHFRQSGGKEYIRILGLKFSNININSSIQEKLQGFIFHRQLRDTNSKKSILCQGICHPMLEFINNNPTTGADVDIPYITPNYFFGNTTINASTRVSFHSDDDPDRLEDIFAFYSPDTIISQINLDSATKIKPLMAITGTIVNTSYLTNQYGSIGDPVNGLLHLFCNFNNYSILTGISEKTLEIKTYEDYDFDTSTIKVLGSEYGSHSGKNLFNYDHLGYVLLKISETDLLNPGTTGSITDVNWIFRGSGDPPVNDDELTYPNSNNSINYLYNLLITNNLQYGNIYNAQYTPIHFEVDASSTTVENIYGGDTYISKFAFKNTGRVKWDTRHGASTWITATPASYRNSMVGTEMRSLSYFYVESEINTEYRHSTTDPIDYYPKNLNISDTTASHSTGILDKDPSFGESSSYNDLYSKSNDIILYVSKPLSFQSVGSYPNRSIFSEQSIEGEQSDSYKVFKANNYFDIPKNTGEIWNTFIHNNKFYIHTPGSLWQAPFNDRTLISNDTSSESFMTGNSGVFSGPAMQIYTLNEGYAGTQSQWCSINTPYGYVFIDNNQRKIFLLGEGLKEISSQGMSSWFFENLSITSLADNPANPNSNGFLGVYDSLHKRVIITKKDGNNSFTIGYSFINGAWISYYDYEPNYYIQKSDSFYSIINNNTAGEQGILWEHNKGDFGMFYNRTPSVSEIEFSVNEGNNVEKIYDNQEVYCDIYDEGLARYIHRDFFDTIQIYNNYQNTEQVNLILTTPQGINDNVKLKKNHYQISIPRDQVLDADSHIFDSANLTSSLGVNDPLRKFRPRIKSKWINVKLRYLNTDNYRITLRQILTYFRQVYR